MNHLWQSTLFAAGAGLLTLLFKRNRAQTRYCLWLAASIKFLVPFFFLVDAGSHFGWRTVPAIAPSSLSTVIEQASQPFASPTPLRTATPALALPSAATWIPAILYAMWAIGSVTVLVSWFLRWRSLRCTLRDSSPLDLPVEIEVRTSPAFAEPGVFGIRRPILLLPAGIAEHLTGPQLQAILSHELCHVRRHDNLATALHMAVEALFWFHPLVWWLGTRLIEERERACDEDVVLGSKPEVYAEGILKICELYLESPLPCVSGVSGANLKKRIEAIMSNRIALELSVAGKAALVAAGTAALALPIAVGILNAPAVQAQSPQVAAKFEVASVKPCKLDDNPGRGGKSGGGGGISWTPERLHVGCATVENLVRDAYLSYPEGKQWAAATRLEPTPEAFGVHYGGGCFFCGRGVSPVSLRLFQQPIQGSPAWVTTDRYTIDAKAEAPAAPEMMRGPMMQALLEDRFKLKIHRQSKEVPVYELTLDKDGPHLQAAQEGNCITGPPTSPRAPDQEQPRVCGRGGVTGSGSGFQSLGTTIAQLCRNLSGWFDRDVIDKTGITGLFDIQIDAHRVDLPDLSTAPPADGIPPPPRDWDRAATFKLFQAALPKIGLKLEPAKGSAVLLVIDHVEHPSGN